MDNTLVSSINSSKTSSGPQMEVAKFSGKVQANFTQEIFSRDRSLEERIKKWLSNKGVVPDEPSSKQRDFYDKSKQGVLTLQKHLTNSLSIEGKHGLGTGGSDHQNKQFGAPKLNFQPNAFGSILQRRGLKPAALDCRTPNSA